MVGSSPLTGDAVTVTVIPAGTHSATADSVPGAGITSNRGPRSTPGRPVMTPPRGPAEPPRGPAEPPRRRAPPAPARGATPRYRPGSAAGRTSPPPAPPPPPAP